MRMKDQKNLLKGLKKSALALVVEIENMEGKELSDIPEMERLEMQAKFKEAMDTEDPGEVSQLIEQLRCVEHKLLLKVG